MTATESHSPGSSGATPSEDERTWAMLAHLSAFSGLFVPFAGNIGGPMLVLYVRRGQSQFVTEQAKEALNFNITVLIGYVFCGLLALIFIGFLLGFALLVAWIAATLIAGNKASEGVRYRYPVSLRLVK